MEGVIKNFRRSVHRQKTNHMIIYLDEIKDKESAGKLVGKSCVWKNSKGTEITGKVASAHGNKGAVRVIFDKGMPGQSLGSKVEIK